MGKSAFLFPGQGAQYVGMGKELHARSEEVRALYREAEEALGFDLARVSFEGPAEELNRTEVCQPAILAASWAAFSELAKAGPVAFDFAAGLSLGEYTALLAAGALDFPSAVRLVRERGRLMQAACDERPGAMASVVGLSPEKIREALAASLVASVVLANYNGPDQIVISGAREAVAAAEATLKRAGARIVIPLKVAGAFHSPLMASAAAGLKRALSETVFRPPRAAVVFNVTGRELSAGEAIPDLLSRQLMSPVLWHPTTEYLHAEGTRSFSEIGPGKVLAGLLRRAFKDVEIRSVPA